MKSFSWLGRLALVTLLAPLGSCSVAWEVADADGSRVRGSADGNYPEEAFLLGIAGE